MSQNLEVVCNLDIRREGYDHFPQIYSTVVFFWMQSFLNNVNEFKHNMPYANRSSIHQALLSYTITLTLATASCTTALLTSPLQGLGLAVRQLADREVLLHKILHAFLTLILTVTPSVTRLKLFCYQETWVPA